MRARQAVRARPCDASVKLMDRELADETSFGLFTLGESSAEKPGLRIRALATGCIYSVDRGELMINQLLASPLDGGVHRIYLRVHDGATIDRTEIVGLRADSVFSASDENFTWTGAWRGIEYRCTCAVDAPRDAWSFHVELKNATNRAIRCDVIQLQDLGLATRGQVRNNETFTSQYLDHFSARHDELGHVLMTRQNLVQTIDERPTHPWLMQWCWPRAIGFTTDGFDFFGAAHRGGNDPIAVSRPIIGQQVRQYETAFTALQSAPVELKPGQSLAVTFLAQVVADHPEASSEADLKRITAAPPTSGGKRGGVVQRERNVFDRCEPFAASDFTAADLQRFNGTRRHEEFDADGRLLSFFYGGDARHVVLRTKELSIPRSHGHILRAGRGWMPDDERLMCCTCYAGGVFASQVALGNASLGTVLSRPRDPLGLVRSSGIRIFVRRDPSEAWQLLGVPSAFEMAIDSCRWHYDDALTVTCSASQDEPILTVEARSERDELEFLISGEIAVGSNEYDMRPSLTIERELGRITIRSEATTKLAETWPEARFFVDVSDPNSIAVIGGDELLFESGSSHGLPYFAIRTNRTKSFSVSISGELRPPSPCTQGEGGGEGTSLSQQRTLSPTLSLSTGRGSRSAIPHVDCSIEELHDTLTWFARDATVHLSTPRGLEQANGGAWGVRDVCQGPVEFLLSYGRGDVVAEILRKLFAQQYHEKGDWPQWFMLPPLQEIRSADAHGDVMIWPLKALCDYLEETDDGAFLAERVRWTRDEKPFDAVGEPDTILHHVDRLMRCFRESFLHERVCLPRYGEGDWDDSLQPVDPAMRERMVSSWTAELLIQTLRRWNAALVRFNEDQRAADAARMADAIEADFRRFLMPDGVVAGFALFDGSTPAEYLLHPRDARTGLRYRLIPMTRAILSRIFTADEATKHLELIRQHLLYLDGARLMDRPTRYSGGVERVFRRSESAAFFGREIGLQYVHAHLRYAEALATMGRADELWHALRVVNPITVTDAVPNARPRQRNCYFSSSDAAFADRYEASRDYEKLRTGQVPTDGGWRIYSSGPGVYTNVVVRHLFGLRRYFDSYEFDPILPKSFDGATIALTDSNGLRVTYRFARSDGAPRVTVNGEPLSRSTVALHPYRTGATRVARSELDRALTRPDNVVQITLV